MLGYFDIFNSKESDRRCPLQMILDTVASVSKYVEVYRWPLKKVFTYFRFHAQINPLNQENCGSLYIFLGLMLFGFRTGILVLMNILNFSF